MIRELYRFSLVGALGFVVDAASLQLLVSLAGSNPYASRLFSYLLAATTTWWLNRRFTFAACSDTCWRRQWLRYLVVNAAGGGVNYGVYCLCLFLSELVRQHLVLGVAAGSIAGLAVNFTASRYLVFQRGKGA
ncbi:MAG: GtrA family protein [Thermodesulfobacteriota bacterium]